MISIKIISIFMIFDFIQYDLFCLLNDFGLLLNIRNNNRFPYLYIFICTRKRVVTNISTTQMYFNSLPIILSVKRNRSHYFKNHSLHLQRWVNMRVHIHTVQQDFTSMCSAHSLADHEGKCSFYMEVYYLLSVNDYNKQQQSWN